MSDPTPLGGISTGEIVGQITFTHPSVLSMVSQLRNLWNANQASFTNCYRDYLSMMAKTSGGPMDMGECLLGAMRAHPAVAPLIVQALGIVYPHIPETQKVITQVQTQVMSAN